MNKNFIVCIDCQYDFMMPDGILYVNGAEETITPIIKYLSSLKPETTSGVLFTFDTHTKEEYEGSPESKLFPIHCEVGTKGHKNVINPYLINDLLPSFELTKTVFDMWDSTEIEKDLSTLLLCRTDTYSLADCNKVEEETSIIDIIGVALNFCVKQAADGFIERGYKVRLHTSMTRGIDTGKPGDLDARVLYADEIANGKVIVVD